MRRVRPARRLDEGFGDRRGQRQRNPERPRRGHGGGDDSGQREAAEIFGGGINAFSRYENGKSRPGQRAGPWSVARAGVGAGAGQGRHRKPQPGRKAWTG